MPTARARHIMETNFWGSWNLCQATLPHLRRAPRGRILLVSSIAGHMGIPFRSAYCASKAALIALSDSLRLELKGSKVAVSCVSPGDIATNSVATQYRQPPDELPELYRGRYRKADEGMATNVAHGMPAVRVANEMLDILAAPSPAPHYTIGEPVQRLSLVAHRLLPARWWENLLNRYYG
jgi:NAD(P)-dependent dehydrogenase (short-subunit alcohol dehydrogenase family)